MTNNKMKEKVVCAKFHFYLIFKQIKCFYVTHKKYIYIETASHMQNALIIQYCMDLLRQKVTRQISMHAPI